MIIVIGFGLGKCFPNFLALSSNEGHRIFFCFVLFCFLGLHLWHMEIPRLGVELELQLPDYAMAIAMQNLSRICDLHCSSGQCQILKALSGAKD